MLLFLLMAILDPEVADAYDLAGHGLRQPGATVPMSKVVDRHGKAVNLQALDHRVRLMVMVEPLGRDEGLKRLAWWSTNAAQFKGLASVMVMPCGSALPAAKTPGLILLDDPQCRQAALFGSIRTYGKDLGALPAVFVIDDSGVVRATIEPAPAKEQAPKILAAVRRLRQQLAQQGQRY